MSDSTDETKQDVQPNSKVVENNEFKPAEARISENAGETIQNTAEPQTNNTGLNAITDKTLYEIKSDITALSTAIQGIADSTTKAAKDIYELHKLYHNEYAKRLTAMQEELEHYRELEKGRAFDCILTEIARVYSDNVSAVDGIADEKIKKRFRYMFLDMLQVLENNGVSKQESKEGDKRNTRHCQVTERILIGDPNLHDTVAKSINIGFYIENRTLIKEMVRVFVYEENREDKERDVSEHKES